MHSHAKILQVTWVCLHDLLLTVKVQNPLTINFSLTVLFDSEWEYEYKSSRCYISYRKIS